MKIVFLAGANSIHSYKWIKYFAQKGHEILWISLGISIHEPLNGVKYHELPPIRGLYSLTSAIIRTRSLIKEFRPDILQLHSVGMYGLLGIFAGCTKLVVTPWGSDVIYGKLSAFKRPIIARAFKTASLITCDALHMKSEIEQFGVREEKIKIINFGIDTERFRPLEQSNEIRNSYNLGKDISVVSLRNFEPVYDIPSLLNAIPIVLQKFPSTKFLIIGRGSLESELKTIAHKLEIEDAVRFIGFVKNDLLPLTLSSMDIYVSSSLSDAGIAASTAEAMACQLPAVITNSGENSNWILDGVNGYLVEVKNPEAIAESIISLIADPEKRAEFGRRGRELILERNDYLSEMGKMEELYLNLTT